MNDVAMKTDTIRDQSVIRILRFDQTLFASKAGSYNETMTGI
jgi:hypothetical protein